MSKPKTGRERVQLPLRVDQELVRELEATTEALLNSKDPVARGLGDSRQKIAEVALDIGLAHLRERFNIKIKARPRRKLTKKS